VSEILPRTHGGKRVWQHTKASLRLRLAAKEREIAALCERLVAAEEVAREMGQRATYEEYHHMAQGADAALARVAELEGLIEDAPHESFCTLPSASRLAQCTCWKAQAAKAKEKP
jgi:hypothetical protein